MRWLPLLLLWPALAWADPITIVAALSSVIGSTAAVAVANVAAFVAANALAIGTIAIGAVGAARQRTKARKAAAAQRTAYNASLQDRSVTLLQANPPHRVVYGRCIVGGDIVAMFTSDKTAVRENGSTYTKSDAYKHLVIVVAAHEVQAINDVLIDGVSIGPLDGSGWVTSGEFYTASKPAIRTVGVAAGSYVDVSPAVVSVVNSWITQGAGVEATYTSASVTLSLGNTRISNANTSDVTVSYTVSTSVAALRVSKFLGTSTQTVDTYLNSVAPTQWTTNHRLRGLAGIVVTLDLEEPRFQAGPPQITVDVSGKKVYDTRTSTTVYTENPALIVRDFLTSAEGLGVNASEIDTTACNTAANACDARLSATVQAHATTFTADASTDQITCAADRWFSTGDGVRLTNSGGTLPAGLSLATTYYVIATASRTVFKLATSVANAFSGTAINITGAGTGTHTVTWYDYAAYTCNGAFATDGSGKEAVLQDLVETMAGTATYGATWIIQAGAWVGSVMSLGDDDLDGQIEIVQAGAGLDAIINGVRGQYIPTGKSTPVDFDPYQNATFLSADGQALWEDVALPYVGNKVRAANLARIRVEQARDGLMVRFPAKLKAWPLQIGDRVAVTSTEYSWTAKTFRVTDWQFGTSTAVILTLQEDAAAIYDLADAVTADQAPNTGLPSPWTVAAVSGVTATSGTSTVLKSGTSPLVPRVLVQWTAITDPYVAGAGGAVEILWRRPGGTWQQTNAPGDATSAYITGVDDGDLLTIEVFARNSLGAAGPSVFAAHTVSGAATVGWNALSGIPGAIAAGGFFDGFEYPTTAKWVNYQGSGEVSIVSISDAGSGGAALRVGNNSGNDQAWLIHADNIPFDPTALYRVKVRIRRNSGTGTIYVGVVGVGSDGVTLVNGSGADDIIGQYYVAAAGASPGSSWTEYTGYIRGTGSPTGSPNTDPSNPQVTHANVRYIRPLLLLNYSAAAGQMEVDFFSIERIGGAIGTLQLGAGAATDVLTTAPSDTDFFTVGPSNVTLASLSYTATYACDVILTSTGTVEQVCSLAQWSTYASIETSSSTSIGSAAYQRCRNINTADAFALGSLAIKRKFSMTAGQSATYYLIGNSGGFARTGPQAGCATNSRSVTLTLEAIKR